MEVAFKASIERLTENATLDWRRGYLEGMGESAYPENMPKNRVRMMAKRGAIVDAQRNLLESLAGVRLTAETTMKDSMTVSDVVQTRVEGFTKGARVVREQDKGDTYEVTLRLPSGRIAAIANEALREPDKFNLKGETIEKWSPHVMPEEKIKIPAEPPEVQPLPIDTAPLKAYTGLIVDCRGYWLRRCMSPKIRRPDGSEVWGTVQVDTDFVNKYGIAIYLTDGQRHLLKVPEITKRIGNNPLVIPAVGVAGTGQTDPVISEANAERLLEANRQYGFLNRFSVLFLQ